MKKFLMILIFTSLIANAQAAIEPIKYGNFNSWVTRHMKESGVIGGDSKTVYEIGPTQTINGNKAYANLGGSPWATSNVYAKVKGVEKCSNAVFPANRGSSANKCAKLCSKLETVTVLGLIDMKVMVAGSIFLGRMIEPITSTSNPYTKMEMGVPYTKRPKNLVFDYRVEMPNVNKRTKASGFGSPKTLQGRDAAVAFVLLQHRWEDANGNIHAKRVATGGEMYHKATNWVNSHKLPLVYGDCSKKAGLGWLGLKTKKNAYYARNSKGKMVPVIEEGWDGTLQPTHLIVEMSAGSGEPYVGTEGLTLYIDNVSLEL
ncbi:MAG: PCMD domain-containing protein [Firmicutes bacterium]|nr:PCMD domain-containing protein [Bacillota bacterium]MCM1401312.1 PCMD domain-containing protein [Bacteroides sp.]MCM1476733.1 PCMD domain-containing protein [Bacteroides sp.]